MTEASYTTDFEIADDAMRALWRDMRDPYRIAAARLAAGEQATYSARDVLNLRPISQGKR